MILRLRRETTIRQKRKLSALTELLQLFFFFINKIIDKKRPFSLSAYALIRWNASHAHHVRTRQE
jgi:hypothetical protein